MNQVLLDYHQDEKMITPSASFTVLDEVESSYQPVQEVTTEEVSGLDEARLPQS